MKVEVRNQLTGKVRLVPERTAEEIRKGKHFKQQGWVVVERSEPPYEVIQFQETAKVKQVTEIKEPSVKTPEPAQAEPAQPIVNQETPAYDIRRMAVKHIAQRLNDFSEEELKILSDDPRKSVQELIKRRLKDG